MTKIHVGRTLLSKRSLQDALHQSKPGDELIIHEGHHRLDTFDIYGIHLTGVGDPTQVVVEGQVNVWSESRLRNLTLRAPHFRNSLYLRQPGARVDLANVTVHAEPAGKYPAVYGNGGTVVMKDSTVHSPPGGRSIDLRAKSYLYAVDSEVSEVNLLDSNAVVADFRATHIKCGKGAKVEAYGHLDLIPLEGRWSLFLSDESVCTVPSLRLNNGSGQAYCQDSYVKIDAITAPAGQTLTVVTKGQSVVDSTSDAVRVQAKTPPQKQGPKVIPWRLADAHSFSTSVAPQLSIGDTVQLDEGEYFLDDYTNHAVGIAAHVVGMGEKTVVHGKIFVLRDQDASLSHVTIRAPKGNNGVANVSGRSLSMTDVVVEPDGVGYPPLILKSGQTKMRNCTVVASEDSPDGATSVQAGATLEAEDSSMGWLTAEGQSTVALERCTAAQISAIQGSTITSRGRLHLRGNTCDMRQVIAEGKSTVSLESLTTDAAYFEAVADTSEFEIGELTTTDPEGVAVVAVQDAPRVTVEGPAVSIVDLETLEQTAAQPETPLSSGAARDVRPGRSADGDEDGHTTDDPLAELDALTGLSSVKHEIHKFTRQVRYNQMREQQGKPATPMVMHSLFLGSPGTGKTTVARLLGEALFRAGAIPSNTFVEVSGRGDLVGSSIGSSAKLTKAVLEKARGGVLFIDEAYSLYKPNNNEFAQESVDTIMTFMENHRDEIVVIFAGYGDQMQDLLAMNPGMKSRVATRFTFEDFTGAEVAEIGYRQIVADHYTVNEELYRRVVAAAYSRSSDRSNGRWVRNFNQDLIAILAQRVVDLDPDEVDVSHIADEDLHAIGGGGSADKEERVQELLAELDAMVGLHPVKEWVYRLVNRVKVDRRRMERDGTSSRPTYHMVFAGNPGTGKTTVARIVAELFHCLDILESPTVKEVKKAQLVGAYIGHTEKNTSKVLDESMGGVLFIDEAYELSTGSISDFGSNVIATLLPRLEDDRDKFVAIFAGYTDEMRTFLEANPGLASRVPRWIEFPDYTAEDVAQIVVAQLSRQWTFDTDHVAEVAVNAYLATPTERQDNGRWARNFAEDLEAEHNEYLATHNVDDDALDDIPTEVIDNLARRFSD